MSKTTSSKDLAEIIVKAINDEPFFSKDVLIPKIRALITGFRLDLSSANYKAIEKPTDKAKLIRSNELHNHEKVFWKSQLEEIIGKENMQKYYDKLDFENKKLVK